MNYGPWRRDPEGYWVFVELDYDVAPRSMGGAEEMLRHLSTKRWFTPAVRTCLVEGMLDHGELKEPA
jgi:hypothetical protein